MCRTVEDATKVLEIIAGYDPKDPVTEHSQGKIPDGYTQFLQKEGLKNARIGVLSHLSVSAHPTIKSIFESAVNEIRSQGAQVLDSVVVPDFDTLRQHQWCAEFKKDIEAYLQEYVQDQSVQTSLWENYSSLGKIFENRRTIGWEPGGRRRETGNQRLEA